MSGAPSSSRLPYDCQGALARSSIWTLFCFMATYSLLTTDLEFGETVVGAKRLSLASEYGC